jgi:hypothetical protein
MSTMQKTRKTLFSFTALLVLPGLYLQKTESKKAHSSESVSAPLIRIDMGKLGGANHELEGCGQCVRIAFVDESLLAVTFMQLVAPTRAQRGNHKSAGGPFPYRTIFFDVKTGELRTIHDWPGATALLPTHEGKFLSTTSKKIELYSSSFQLLASRDLPPNGPGSAFSHATVSWSGKRIAIQSYKGPSATRLELLDADSLEVLHSWVTAGNSWNLTAADDAIAIETPQGIRFFGDSWPTSTQASHMPCGTEPAFVSNDILALKNCENETLLIDRTGKIVSRTEPREPNTDLYTITTSQNKSLFGALVYRTYCEVSWFECLFDSIQGSTPERTAIYDASTGRAIFERQTRGDHKHTLGEIALSPHGSLLAVLSRVRFGWCEGIIEIFALPPLGKQDLP